FDHVLFATSLDHMLNPHKTLLEAKRVIKPKGKINIWITYKSNNRIQKLGAILRHGEWRRLVKAAARRLKLWQNPDDAYLATLNVPAGAVDQYHVVDLNQPVLN